MVDGRYYRDELLKQQVLHQHPFAALPAGYFRRRKSQAAQQRCTVVRPLQNQ